MLVPGRWGAAPGILCPDPLRGDRVRDSKEGFDLEILVILVCFKVEQPIENRCRNLTNFKEFDSQPAVIHSSFLNGTGTQ